MDPVAVKDVEMNYRKINDSLDRKKLPSVKRLIFDQYIHTINMRVGNHGETLVDIHIKATCISEKADSAFIEMGKSNQHELDERMQKIGGLVDHNLILISCKFTQEFSENYQSGWIIKKIEFGLLKRSYFKNI